MSSAQRTFTAALWVLVVFSLLGLLAMQRWAARRDAASREMASATAAESMELNPDRPTTLPDEPIDLNFPAPTFNFIDQHGQPFDSAKMKGKIWTASLFFSECKGICPMVREKFEALQAVATDPDVEFVSFTVDPEKDTPEKLAEYARLSKADPTRAHLLTGDVKEIHRIAAEFLIPFDLPVNHSGRVLLVDREGVVRRFYSGTSEIEMTRLAQDIKALIAETK